VPAQGRAVPSDLVLLAAVPRAAALELAVAAALGQVAAWMAAALEVPEPVVLQAAAPEVDKQSLVTEVALSSSWSMGIVPSIRGHWC